MSVRLCGYIGIKIWGFRYRYHLAELLSRRHGSVSVITLSLCEAPALWTVGKKNRELWVYGWLFFMLHPIANSIVSACGIQNYHISGAVARAFFCGEIISGSVSFGSPQV